MACCIFPEWQESIVVLLYNRESSHSVWSKAEVVPWVLLHFNLLPPAPFLPQKPKASIVVRRFVFLRTRPKVFQFGLPNEEHSVGGHLPRCLVCLAPSPQKADGKGRGRTECSCVAFNCLNHMPIALFLQLSVCFSAQLRDQTLIGTYK